MNTQKLTSLLFLIVNIIITNGQHVDFIKKIGKSNTPDWGYSVKETFDKGFVIAGLTNGLGFGQDDIYIVKTDENGDTSWTKTYGTAANGEFAKSVIQTTDGGYAVLGHTQSFGAGGADVYLIRTNLNGDTLWTKTYGGQLNDDGACLQQTNDGGFVIVGSTASFGNTNYDIYLIKTNQNGDTLWTRTYGDGMAGDFGTYVQQTTDNGYIITGYTYGFNTDSLDLYLIKVNSIGGIQWQKTYDGPENGASSGDFGTAVQETFDGGYIVTGTQGYTHATGFTGNTLLLKTNSNGNILWTNTYGQDNLHESNGADVKQCADGGYIVLANRSSIDSGLDVYLLKTDTQGDTIWTKTIGEGDTDKGLSIDITSDQSYIISGYTYEISNWYQVYLIKISDIEVGINDTYDRQIQSVIYPNPIEDIGYVEFLNPNHNLFFLEIYNELGKLTKTYSTNSEKVRIDRGSLASGSYSYRLRKKNNLIESGTLIFK